MTTTGKRGRLFRRAEPDPDDGDADLSEEEHAWWAAREEVAGVPRGRTAVDDTEAPPPEPDAHFADYWTTESLFDEAPPGAPPPGAPPPGPPPPHQPAGDQHEPAFAEGMDLDVAHLVLQVRIGADWEHITAAHRQLAKLYHPDRLISYSPEAQEVGRVRMSEINAAHATLRSLHFH